MNPVIKKKWVGALRSGEYQQGRGRLNDNNAFCCLGVLCDLHVKETGGKWTRILSSKNGFEYKGTLVGLPDEVLKWANLNDFRGGEVIYQDDVLFFPALNDHLQLSFKQIADLIEAQL